MSAVSSTFRTGPCNSDSPLPRLPKVSAEHLLRGWRGANSRNFPVRGRTSNVGRPVGTGRLDASAAPWRRVVSNDAEAIWVASDLKVEPPPVGGF
jgi:hypothetical protein